MKEITIKADIILSELPVVIEFSTNELEWDNTDCHGKMDIIWDNLKEMYPMNYYIAVAMVETNPESSYIGGYIRFLLQ